MPNKIRVSNRCDVGRVSRKIRVKLVAGPKWKVSVKPLLNEGFTIERKTSVGSPHQQIQDFKDSILMYIVKTCYRHRQRVSNILHA